MKNLLKKLKKLLNKKNKDNDNVIIEMNQIFKDNNDYADLNNHTIHHIIFISKRKKE